MLRTPGVALLALVAASAGCKKATEIVLRLDAMGGTPSTITVRLQRTRPFNDNPVNLPPFVVAQLAGADLELLVTPQGASTTLSLLPSKGAPPDALQVSAGAAGFKVDPATAQEVSFAEGQSRELRFVLTALPPPVDMAGARDLAMPRDGGATDGGPGPGDAAAPNDGATGG